MKDVKKYFAFISYKSEDAEWAIWLQHELEHYHLPASFNGRTDIPKELRPIFRDIDELSAGNLPNQIQQALVNSHNLIVICSPQSANSSWVNKEVETFINLGRTHSIFPFIVEGNSPIEYFPPALLNLPRSEERLGGDVNRNGKNAAFIKVVSGMLNLAYDTLWNRYEREKAKEERKIREQRDYLLTVQSQYLSERALSLISDGDSYTARLLAVEALPPNISNPERPFVHEAEVALRKATQSESAILYGHTGIVRSVNFSNDNKLIVSSSSDRSIRIWDASTGTLLNTLGGHTGTVTHAIFSPDDKYIASASTDNTVRIWGVESGENLHILHGHTDTVNSVAFSPIDQTLASCSNDDTVILWDITTGCKLMRLEGDEYKVWGYREDISAAHVDLVSFTSNGEYLLASLRGGTIRIFDVKTGNIIEEYVAGRHANFSSDGKYMVSILEDDDNKENKLIVKNFLSGKTYIHKGPFGVVYTVFMSHDNQYIVTASNLRNLHENKYSINVWEASTGKLLQSSTIPHSITYANFSSDGNRIVLGSEDCTIRIIDTILFNPNNKIYENNRIISCMSISPCGGYLAIAQSNVIKILDFKTLALIKELKGHNSTINSIAYDPNGVYIASGSFDHLVIVWDTKNGKICHVLNGHDSGIKSLAFSPNGNILVSLSDGYPEVIIWDVKRGKEIFRPLDPFHLETYANKVTFSPKGTFVAITGFHHARLWKFQENDLLPKSVSFEYLKDFKGEDYAVFNPSGEQIAICLNKIINIYDINSGELLNTLEGHTEKVWSIDYSPDGKRMVSSSEDKTIKLWDVETGTMIQSYEGHKAIVTSAIFSPDGNYIISKSPDKTIRIWNCPPLQQLINDTVIRFKKRSFTKDERKKYYLI